MVTTGLIIRGWLIARVMSLRVVGWITDWLWFIVPLVNSAHTLRAARGQTWTKSLGETATDTIAKLLLVDGYMLYEPVHARQLHKGEVVLVDSGDIVPSDGDVLEGFACVEESTILRESERIIHEGVGHGSAVMGGMRVLSGWIKVRVKAEPGSHYTPNAED